MERNILLDYFKIILSILVICIHMLPLFGNGEFTGWIISHGLARIAVPIFFIICGYYIGPKLNDPKKIRKYLIHLIIVYVTWMVIYLPFYYGAFYNIKNTIRIVVIGYHHLWYIPALISGIVFFFIINKYVKNHICILVIALSLFLFGFYCSLDYARVYYYRNGIIMGFPFIALGYYLQKYNYAEKVKNSYLLIGIFIGLVLLVGESYFQYINSGGFNPYQDFRLALLIICPAIFLYIQKHAVISSGKEFVAILFSGIYFIHPLAMNIIGMPQTYMIYKLPLVVILSIALSYIVYLINKRVKIFF